MNFKLFKVSGYEDAILSLRMSKGRFYDWKKARDIQQLVWAVTDSQGFICMPQEYACKVSSMHFNELNDHTKLTGNFYDDLKEFKRLLELTFNNSMKDHKHHTLMKYIDVTFITEGLHRGAQDDLDAHALGFNNRITRFSTRLAEISSNELSEWYKGKIIPFYKAIQMLNDNSEEQVHFPPYIKDENDITFKLTPLGYVVEKHAQIPAKNGLAKDIQRGLMHLALPSDAIWKSDIFNLRYIYKMRNKLTKANPELKEGIDQLAKQIEKNIPIFGPYFIKEYTDTKQWEHMNKVKTITASEYEDFKKWKREKTELKNSLKSF